MACVEQDAFDRTTACPRSHASAGARNVEGHILEVTHLHLASGLVSAEAKLPPLAAVPRKVSHEDISGRTVAHRLFKPLKGWLGEAVEFQALPPI